MGLQGKSRKLEWPRKMRKSREEDWKGDREEKTMVIDRGAGYGKDTIALHKKGNQAQGWEIGLSFAQIQTGSRRRQSRGGRTQKSAVKEITTNVEKEGRFSLNENPSK